MRRTAACLVVGVAAALAAPAWSQVKSGAETGTGLSGGEIPPLLKQIQSNPYRPPAAPACDTIPAEIRQITQVIGADFDTPAQAVSKQEDYKERGAGVARSLIPYGGAFRAVSGADKKDKALAAAVDAGYARRGFLRGVLLNVNCNAAAAPAKPASAAAKPPSASAKPKSRK